TASWRSDSVAIVPIVVDRGLPPPPASSPLSALGNRPPRCLGADLENIQRVDPSRFAIPGNKDRVPAAMDRSDNHQIVRQMETFDAQFGIAITKLLAHAG